MFFLTHSIDFEKHKGKLIGLCAGLVVFGFWGGCLGAIAGAAFDEWVRFLSEIKSYKNASAPPPQTASVLAVVMLARQFVLPVLVNPLQTIEVLKKYFALDHSAIRYVGKALHAQKQDADIMDYAVLQLRAECAGVSTRIHNILCCLFDLAKDTNGFLDKTTVGNFQKLAEKLGMGAADFAALATIKGYLPDAIYDPYQILGLPTGASLDIAAKAYRRLMQEYHPDRLVEKNAIAIARAQEKSVLINDAYMKIKKMRAA